MNCVPFLDFYTWLRFLINPENLPKSGLFLLNKYYYCIATSLQSFKYPPATKTLSIAMYKKWFISPFWTYTVKLRFLINLENDLKSDNFLFKMYYDYIVTSNVEVGSFIHFPLIVPRRARKALYMSMYPYMFVLVKLL